MLELTEKVLLDVIACFDAPLMGPVLQLDTTENKAGLAGPQALYGALGGLDRRDRGDKRRTYRLHRSEERHNVQATRQT